MRPIDELILIYNADAGLVSAFVDSARKLFKLNGCTLCALTHGLAGERAEWQDCKAAFGVPIRYYHRDDVPPTLRDVAGGSLPAVVARVADEHRLLLGPDSLARCNGKVSDLRGRLRHAAKLEGLALNA